LNPRGPRWAAVKEFKISDRLADRLIATPED
jgi:hypothetical protein